MQRNRTRSGRLRSWFSLGLLISSIIVFTRTLRASEFDDHTQKEFPVKPGETLFLDADYGGVEVKAGAGNSVHVDVYRKVEASTKEEAQLDLSSRGKPSASARPVPDGVEAIP